MKRNIITALVISVTTLNCLAQELADWRGPNRTGIYKETGLLRSWPADGPKLLWSYDGLGKGFSTVAIAEGKIFTTGEVDSTGSLFAFDLQGKLIWKVVYGQEWDTKYPGSRATPVYYKGKLFFLTGKNEAVSFDAKTGKKLWTVDLEKKFGARNITFGVTESPEVNGNKVYFTVGGDSISVVALNTETGETIWKTKATGGRSTYCSPLLFEHNGKKYLTTSLAEHIIGIDAETGAFLWKVKWDTSSVPRRSNHPNTPIYKNGYLYNVCGYKVGGVLLKLSDDGKNATEVWRNISLDNQIGGAVWINDYIIGSGHQNDRSWQALDAKTGTVLFKTDSLKQGAIVSADGLLFGYADNGDVGLLEVASTGFTLKSKFKIKLGTDQHWAHPVIDKGILYIRHGNTLLAFEVK